MCRYVCRNVHTYVRAYAPVNYGRVYLCIHAACVSKSVGMDG